MAYVTEVSILSIICINSFLMLVIWPLMLLVHILWITKELWLEFIEAVATNLMLSVSRNWAMQPLNFLRNA